MPWLVGMTYKAVRTDRYKYIHWVNRGMAGELDELYDLDNDPFELDNLNRSRKLAPVREKLRRELKASLRRRWGCRSLAAWYRKVSTSLRTLQWLSRLVGFAGNACNVPAPESILQRFSLLHVQDVDKPVSTMRGSCITLVL